MRKSSVLVLATVALLVFVGAVAAGPITVREFWGGGNGTSYFSVSNNSADLFVAGFAVGNDTAWDVSTGRMGWDAVILGAEAWDEGYTFPLGGMTTTAIDNGHVIGTVIDTSEIGTFDGLFGEGYNQALLYHGTSLLYGGPNLLAPGGFDDQFHFLAGGPDSPYFIILDDGTVLGPFDTEDAPIPEPGSLALMGLGLAGLGLALRRRRRKAA